VTSCTKWNDFGLNASVIRGGDSAGVLRKLYTCLRVAASAKAGRKPLNAIYLGWKFLKGPFFGMAMIADKILTIRLIKLWKHPCRIIEVEDQPFAPITEALLLDKYFS
jgi:hypothetical protein